MDDRDEGSGSNDVNFDSLDVYKNAGNDLKRRVCELEEEIVKVKTKVAKLKAENEMITKEKEECAAEKQAYRRIIGNARDLFKTDTVQKEVNEELGKV